MADAFCHQEQCFYTGTPSQSKAAPGPCTGTGGYISNAELEAIKATPGRVQQSYLDKSSHSDIMVYDGDQWVGWMSPTVKAARRTLYKQISMGGVSDWATDLQEYHDPPSLAASWADLKNTVNLGLIPDQVGTRTGNWTQVQCDNQAVTWRTNMTAAHRWSMADGNNA